MKEYVVASGSSAMSALSFIATGSLVASVICVVCIILVCCYNLIWHESTDEWPSYLARSTQPQNHRIPQTNPSLKLPNKMHSVTLLTGAQRERYAISTI